jgi:hypothetical protein
MYWSHLRRLSSVVPIRLRPCLLDNALVADSQLKQVCVQHNFGS